jgi:hypothetical protein
LVLLDWRGGRIRDVRGVWIGNNVSSLFPYNFSSIPLTYPNSPPLIYSKTNLIHFQLSNSLIIKVNLPLYKFQTLCYYIKKGVLMDGIDVIWILLLTLFLIKLLGVGTVAILLIVLYVLIKES